MTLLYIVYKVYMDIIQITYHVTYHFQIKIDGTPLDSEEQVVSYTALSS